MSVARKVRRNNESNRREELLRVSAKLFREKGFDGTTIRDISGAAGMHSGSPSITSRPSRTFSSP